MDVESRSDFDLKWGPRVKAGSPWYFAQFRLFAQAHVSFIFRSLRSLQEVLLVSGCDMLRTCPWRLLIYNGHAN